MEIQEALRIMRALADGVNPETGEAMTTDSVYQYAPAVRALPPGGERIGVHGGTTAKQTGAAVQGRQVVVAG